MLLPLLAFSSVKSASVMVFMEVNWVDIAIPRMKSGSSSIQIDISGDCSEN